MINQLYIIKKLQVSGSGACNHHLLNHIPNSFYFNLLVHVSTIFAWLQSSDCVSFLAYVEQSTELGYGLHLSGYLDNLMSWISPHRLSPGPEDRGCNWWTSLSLKSGSTDSSSKVPALCHCTVPQDTSLKHKYCFTLKVFVPFKTKLLIYEQ